MATQIQLQLQKPIDLPTNFIKIAKVLNAEYIRWRVKLGNGIEKKRTQKQATEGW